MTTDGCGSAVTVADSLMKGDTTARFFIGIAYTVGSDSIMSSSLEKWSSLENYYKQICMNTLILDLLLLIVVSLIKQWRTKSNDLLGLYCYTTTYF